MDGEWNGKIFRAYQRLMQPRNTTIIEECVFVYDMRSFLNKMISSN